MTTQSELPQWISGQMKYGILFSIVALLLATTAFAHGGWHSLALWPSLSFAIVAAAYFRLGAAVYGKSLDGKLAIRNQLLLLPYLFYLWAVWYGIRFITREAAYDQLTENIFIGRRLLAREVPENFDHVIDLTSEFTEPEPLRSGSYHSFQVLDADVPPLKSLQEWVTSVAALSGNIYIHCAEGHGRTGLFAAAVLLHTGHSSTPPEAIRFIRTKRHLVRLNKSQREQLDRFHEAR